MRENDKVLSKCVDHIHRDTIDDDMPRAKKFMIILAFKHEGTLTKVSLLAYIVSWTNKMAASFIYIPRDFETAHKREATRENPAHLWIKFRDREKNFKFLRFEYRRNK